MVLVTSAIHAHAKKNNVDVNRQVKLVNSIMPLIYIGYCVDFILIVTAFYYYFKCNWAKGVKASGSDKILGFLGACCCNLLYVIYHVVVPC